MTYAVHGLTAMSSPSTANLVCDQFVLCVLFHIHTDCVTNVAGHGDESQKPVTKVVFRRKT